MPKFSIIIPVFNVEEYLYNCLESILYQSYKDFELILIDDGSQDSSPQICDEYAAKDTRIKVIHKKNGGVSSARNEGLKIAQGKYIWFIDSDDSIEKECFTQLNEMVTKEYDLVIFNRDINVSIDMTDLDQFFYDYYFNYKSSFSSCNKIYKKRIIQENNLWFDTEETIGEDKLFNINYYIHIKKIYVSTLKCYIYNIRDGSAMTTLSKNSHINQIRLYDKISNILRNKVSTQVLSVLFIMHLFSGIAQSRKGGLTEEEYTPFLTKYIHKYKFANKVMIKSLNIFLNGEKVSLLGRLRLNIFFYLIFLKKYKLALKILFFKR